MIKNLFILPITISLCHAELIFPENGAILNYIHILFQWEQEPDAVGYNLQALDESFDIVLDIGISKTAYIDDSTFTWNSNYYWRVRSIYLYGSNGEWSELSIFTTSEPLPHANLDIDIYNDSLTQEGLMLFSQVSPNFGVIIIDKFGNQIWNSQYAYINHWNNFGQLYGMKWERAVEVTFYNQTLWMSPEGTEIDAHETKQLPNGNYMAFVPTYQLGPIPLGDWTEAYQNLGYIADGETNEFLWRGTKTVEWNGETGEEVWNWNPFDHFTMDDYDTYEDRWWSPIQGSHYGLMYDWNHSNAFHFDEIDSVVYVSHRNLSRISKIGYPSGTVIWNMGPSAEYGYGNENICMDLGFSCQHHIQLLNDGDLLFFDNGNLSEMLVGDPYPTTRIRRISVIDNSYCETVWQYDLPTELFGAKWGSVQLLANGNYFIYTHGTGFVQGAVCTILEVTPDGEVVWKGSHTIINAIWYRAYKIPSIHPIAYSVLIGNYNTAVVAGDTTTGIMLDDANSSLTFTIHNQSGYSQPYMYSLSDNNEWFGILSDTVYIEAGEQSLFSFYPAIQGDSVTSLQLVVKPVYHSWALKDLNYDVYRISGVLRLDDFPLPNAFNLSNPYPNPFNPRTTISYELPNNSFVNITIYDMMGRQVKTLVSDQQTAGYRSLQWNATNNSGSSVSAGIYLYMIQAGDFRQTKKMVLLK